MTATRRVLIIDDNRDAADLLRDLVSLYGHSATVAYGGEQGLAAAQTVEPDVAFVDIGMPDMDGYAVARALRRTAHGAKMRLIALTAWSDRTTRELVKAAGFDVHLGKPATLDAVMAHLA
ncbi:response regulator [Massilia endophytica]|uniref:response regulator n=1 Tax=Massilia endophytica TaxID=2899220 RepID=UPI001E2D1529|nr:response regulator [Massilia endophytica]UGQ49096.1 response regulator [Massilia endophytica]